MDNLVIQTLLMIIIVSNYYYEYLKYSQEFDKKYPNKNEVISEKINQIKQINQIINIIV